VATPVALEESKPAGEGYCCRSRAAIGPVGVVARLFGSRYCFGSNEVRKRKYSNEPETNRRLASSGPLIETPGCDSL